VAETLKGEAVWALSDISSLHPGRHGIRFMVPDRVDITIHSEFQRSVEVKSAEHLDTWLAPWLDITTLADSPLTLLALVHHRVSRRPADWVLFDYQHTKLAQRYGFLGKPFNPHCVRLTAEGYGTLED
jgi:hypothetical protein